MNVINNKWDLAEDMSGSRKCRLCGRQVAMEGQGPWRVGRHYGIHVYEGDRPVATFHRVEDARRAVEAINASAVESAQ